MQSWISSIITPFFSVTWSFKNHSCMWFCCSNISYYYHCWKQLCCLMHFCRPWYIWIIKKKKKTAFIWNVCFYNNVEVFTFDQFNSFLLIKSIIIIIIIIIIFKSYWLLTFDQFYLVSNAAVVFGRWLKVWFHFMDWVCFQGALVGLASGLVMAFWIGIGSFVSRMPASALPVINATIIPDVGNMTTAVMTTLITLKPRFTFLIK